jgi:hypothetical protein
MMQLVGKLRRAASKPPAYVLQRMVRELGMWSERYRAPIRIRRLSAEYLSRQLGHAGIDAWWEMLARRPYLAHLELRPGEHESVCPGDAERIMRRAEDACAHTVDILGAGPVMLGRQIDWHRDYKTGFRWPAAYCADLEYGKPGHGADVKFPWELSRLQWLIPVVQDQLIEPA